MKICIPTKTNDGKLSCVHDHFGSAAYFTIYDTDTDTAEVIDNSNQHHTHGMCQPLAAIANRNIDAVVCRGMGGRAVQKLNEGSIKAYRTAAETVQDVIALYRKGNLEEITPQNACNQHNCH